MQIEKRQETAFIIYFVLLFLLVSVSFTTEMNLINIVYFVVVLCCSLKFILIVNRDKK